MKGAVLQIIFFVLVITGCQSPNPVPSSSPEVVQKEVRLELEQFSQLSGKSDLKGILARFDDQADIILVGSDAGEVFKGRAAMEGWLGKLYKYSGFSWKMNRIEISNNGNTAWAFVEVMAVVTKSDTGALRFTAPYRFSAVLVKQGESWKWKLFHGSAPAKE